MEEQDYGEIEPIEADVAIVPAGVPFFLATGEYSDYYVIGVFTSPVEINLVEAREKYISTRPEQMKKYHSDLEKFQRWLIQEFNLHETKIHGELIIGTYSCITPSYGQRQIYRLEDPDDASSD